MKKKSKILFLVLAIAMIATCLLDVQITAGLHPQQTPEAIPEVPQQN